MKIKTTPEDFQVEELTAIEPGKQGDHGFYRLEKRGWSTVDVLGGIRRIWRIEPHRINYGGLKDRHALTIQYLTILHGPKGNLENQGWRLKYLGQVPDAFSSKDIASNRFQITIRNRPPRTGNEVQDTLEEIRTQGLPNYFDDQRFGSYSGPGGEYIGKKLVQGDFEGALKQALAQPYSHDRASQKKEKAILRKLWGDWEGLVRDLPKGHARSLSDYLRVHPGDFKGAVARLRPELKGLYLSAFQSAIWNQTLARWYELNSPPESLIWITSKIGRIPLHRKLPDEAFKSLQNLEIPLLSSRSEEFEVEPTRQWWQPILESEGLTIDQMKVPGLRELFFSRGLRPALLAPKNLGHQFLEDEMHPGRSKLILRYDLTRGSYATMLVKRVQMAVAGEIGPKGNSTPSTDNPSSSSTPSNQTPPAKTRKRKQRKGKNQRNKLRQGDSQAQGGPEPPGETPNPDQIGH